MLSRITSLAVTSHEIALQAWDNETGYQTVRMTSICEITDIIIKDQARGGQIVVVVTDQPGSYKLTTPFGILQVVVAQEFVSILWEKMAMCPE